MGGDGLAQAAARMRARGLDETSIAVFAQHYRQLADGAQGLVPEDSIEPLTDIAELSGVRATHEERAAALARIAVLRLNGGLGTSMGLSGPKTALAVRDGLTFLDVIVRQVLALRRRYAVELPLLLMNSFRTESATEAALESYPDLVVDGLPTGFLQSAVPKLRADDLTPVEHPRDPDLEWCPPGHGDVYVSLARTGLLDALRAKGIRYLFLSNADNLGATCDPDLAVWLTREAPPFVAEVCTRTVNDRKGGHLARRRSDGQLVLRDSAMVVPGEEEFFADETRHATFNTNNLWVDLEVLASLMAQRQGGLGLPIIVNRKTVDPADRTSTPVIQLESAMGAAVEAIPGARALLVPRQRFRPVKTTNELLLLRSDRYALDEDSRLVATTTTPEPMIDLDGHYTLVPDFEQRFPAGAPGLLGCASLTVRGDVTFGRDVACRDVVMVDAGDPIRVPDGTVLSGRWP